MNSREVSPQYVNSKKRGEGPTNGKKEDMRRGGKSRERERERERESREPDWEKERKGRGKNRPSSKV